MCASTPGTHVWPSAMRSDAAEPRGEPSGTRSAATVAGSAAIFPRSGALNGSRCPGGTPPDPAFHHTPMSDPSIAFIIDRASKSTAVAITFTAQWTWDEKTPAQHDAMRTGVEFTEAAGETLKATMLQARSNLDDALDQYHRWTVQGLSLARTLEDVNEAWYAAATAVFPAGTPQGELIRGQVPTTYTPGNAPAALEIGSLHQDNATAVTVNYTPGGGTGATALTLQYKLPGEAAFGHDAPVVEPSQQVVAAAFAGALVIFRTRATVSGGETLGAEKSIQM